MVAVAAVALSVALLLVLITARPFSSPTSVSSAPHTVSPSRELGDPVLAQRLADQASEVPASQPEARLRFLLAAHVVAPDRATYRIGLAEAMLPSVTPVRLVQTALDAGPVTLATLSSDASFLITGSRAGGRVWQTRWTNGPTRVELRRELDGPVTAAAAGGMLAHATLLIAGDGDLAAWRAVALVTPHEMGRLGPPVDAMAVSSDGATAVTVLGTSATLWDVGGPDASAKIATSFDRPVTTLAFAPGGLTLVAGHADGGLTIKTIDLLTDTASTRSLTGTNGPVTTVAVSADASTAIALHQDGSVSVWDLRADRPSPAATMPSAVAASGARQLWLGPTGDYAFIADTTTGPTVWSLADRAAPHRMLSLDMGGTQRVPAMVSADGRTMVSIAAPATVRVQDLGSIVDVLAEPIARACAAANMTEQRWRELVLDGAYPNPCAKPGLPTLGGPS